eukprot:jgi/Bigna1/79474/fgenesh1_pg.62_\
MDLQVPPKMKIITTARGTYRFNANLYANGKVCLSLLGTWSGPGWEPSYSNLQQVLISIQAMILGIDEPIANEPSWERDRGTDRSFNYNRILNHGTMLYAMHDHLKAPPPGFEDLVKLHFWDRKQVAAEGGESGDGEREEERMHLLEKQIPMWEKEIMKVPERAKGGPYNRENRITEPVSTTVKKLKAELDKLKPPEEEEEEEEESDDDDF